MARNAYNKLTKMLDRLVGTLAGPLDLDPEQLLREAEAEVGACFHKQPSVQPQLGYFFADMEEQNPSDLGRALLILSCKKFLTNRLLLERELRAEPSCQTRAIKQPVFIVGLQRTGSTYLQALLADDDDARAFRLWELAHPTSNISSRARQRKAKLTCLARSFLQPKMSGIHPLSFDSFEECMWLFANSWAVVCYGLQAYLPRWEQWLAGADMAEHYRFYRRQLQLLRGHDDGRRLVLKCPDHLWHLDALLNTFPDARIIWTHRDPLAIVPSYCSLTAQNLISLFGRCDPARIGDHVRTRLCSGIDRGLAQRALISPEQIIDIQYDQLVKNPSETMERIYRHFGWPMGERYRWQIGQRNQRTKKRISHAYALSDYDLTSAQIRVSFAPYYDFIQQWLPEE